MQTVALPEVSREFIALFQAARRHLQQVGGEEMDWLRTEFNFPFRDHLSFRLGNRLFFLLVATADEDIESPGSLEALEELAAEANGIAGIMLMTRASDGEFKPYGSGFSLFEFDFVTPIEPANLVTDERVVISDWELQRCAIQAMMMHLEKHHFTVLNTEVDPQGAPAIWFRSAEGYAHWMVVKGLRYPDRDAPLPPTWEEKVKFMAEQVPNSKGFYGIVTIASPDDTFDPRATEHRYPLYRGQQYPMKVMGLKGLAPL